MSLLDGMFDSAGELPVSPAPLMADATVEPGFMYLISATDEPRRITVASHAIDTIVGKRIALKVIVGDESEPSSLTLVVPSGQKIEDAFGNLGSEVSIPGGQTPTTYVEWTCDPNGVWWFVQGVGGGGGDGGGGGTSLPIASGIIVADRAVTPGQLYLVDTGAAEVVLTIGGAIANDLIGVKLVVGAGDFNPVRIAAGGALHIEDIDDSHTARPDTALWYEGTCAIFQFDASAGLWRLIHYTRGTGSGEAPFPRDLASAIGTNEGYTLVAGSAADVGAILIGAGFSSGAPYADWLLRGVVGDVLSVVGGDGGDMVGWQPPGAAALHAPSHADGGTDELNVTGLSGKLADPQTPLAHKTSHQLGGGDVINVAGLSGKLADPQTPLPHAASHVTGGTDAIGLATGAVDGLMAAASVTKLAGIAAGADVTLTALAAAAVDIAVNSRKITGLANPTNAQDACTKAYADAVTQGLDVKQSCRVIATTNIALTGTQTIDGVAVVAGDRVLCAGQTAAPTNGIYVVAAGAWARAADADTSAEVTSGLFVFVVEGTGNADSGWVLTTLDPIVLGTTALVFAQFSGAGQIQAGAGLTKTGNTINVVANGDGSLVVAADDVKVGILATDAQHGSRGGGTTHAAVTTTVNGFMLATDKVKLDGIAGSPPVTLMSASFTAAVDNIYIVDTTGGAVTVTLPPIAGNANKQITIKRRLGTGFNNVIIDGNASEAIDIQPTLTLAVPYEWVTLVCHSTGWYQIG